MLVPHLHMRKPGHNGLMASSKDLACTPLCHEPWLTATLQHVHPAPLKPHTMSADYLLAKQGLLGLLNIQTGVEQLSEVEFGLTFLFILFLTEDPERSDRDSS